MGIKEMIEQVVSGADPKKLLESSQRYCLIYKATNGKWYLELANREYGERDDAQTYGPFSSEDGAHHELNKHSNPGGYDVDDRGKLPVPTKSPNGRPVAKTGRF